MPDKPILQPIPSAIPEYLPDAASMRFGCALSLDMQDTGSRIFDYSGMGNHGANSGSIPSAGYAGVVRSFDGVDDYIDCGKQAALNDLPQLSVEMWFKRNSLGGSTVGRHVDKGKWILDCPGSQRMSFQRLFSSTNGYWVSPANGILTGRWHHVLVTYDSTSAANLPAFYVNGLPVTTSVSVSPAGSALSDGADNLYLGNNTARNRGFDGQMGLVRLYNRIIAAVDVMPIYRENAWKYGLPA